MSKFTALVPKLDALKVMRVRVVTLLCMGVPVVALAAALRFLPRTLTEPTSPAEFWAVVSAAASVFALCITLGVGIIAWYGLRSLRLARHDMITRATRDARALAIERAEQFAHLLRDEHSVIQRELVAASAKPFTHDLQSGAQVFDDQGMYLRARAWWTPLPVETRSRIIYFLNDVEAWAMYFTHALADSEVVFGPCAPTYCSIVLQYSPWIVICRKEQYAGYYPNMVALFHSWRAELDAKERGSKTEAALRSAQAAEERFAKLRVPAPLGTKVDI